MPPRITVVTATYNRSNVLALAIRSVLAQSEDDWELIVVGDACTDDTEGVVASFGDPRIRFVNLDRNCGEQSGPNNAGAAVARGRYLAYLNHDDQWLPDHLEAAVEGLERMDADLVFTLEEVITVGGARYLAGAAASGEYEPAVKCPASSWVFRRGLVEEIGPWRRADEIFDVPSVDWLDRAWRAGKRLRLVPRLTVVAVQSTHREGTYAQRASDVEEEVARQMKEPGFRERELSSRALAGAARDPEFRQSLAVAVLRPRSQKRVPAPGRPARPDAGRMAPSVSFSAAGRRGCVAAKSERIAGQETMNKNWLLEGAQRDGESTTADWELAKSKRIEGVLVREVRRPDRRRLSRRALPARLGPPVRAAGSGLPAHPDAGQISAWHAHAETTDRLFATGGVVKVVLYDARPESPTHSVVNPYRFREDAGA